MRIKREKTITIITEEDHSCPYCGEWFVRMTWYKENKDGTLEKLGKFREEMKDDRDDGHNINSCRKKYFDNLKRKEINYREVQIKDCDHCKYSKEYPDYGEWECRKHNISVWAGCICDDWEEY